MARTRSDQSPASKILAVIDAHPGQYLAVATIAEKGGFTGGQLACLPGYMTSLSDQSILERSRVANPVSGGWTSVWGYRRAGVVKEEETAAPYIAWRDRPDLGLDPAGRALLNPPRAWQRAASLSNDDFQKRGA